MNIEDTHWFPIADSPHWSVRMWQNGRNGLVLSLEENPSGNDYKIVTLPENWENDNQIIDHVGNFADKESALEGAETYMKEE